MVNTFGKKGDTVRVISDKGFSYPEDKKFEAVGNVVISYQNDAIYGEKATLDMQKRQIIVVGNVRFIGSNTTFYGAKLFYNLDRREFQIFNARVLSDNFVVLGQNIKRQADSNIIAVGAEYTTCRDCPESWTIYGKEVTIIPHKYIHIRHAYLKAKGVVFLYIPYIVFPIKTKRETGILIPKLSFESNEGLYFQQPFFWAINRSSDLTFTPSYFGDRGLGAEIEYRKLFTAKKWIEFNTLMLNDKIYLPNNSSFSEFEPNGKSYFRHYSTLEYNYHLTPRLRNHTYAELARDADMSRVFNDYIMQRELGSEQRVQTFVDYRGNAFQFDAEASYNRNVLFQKSDGFDRAYVQQLPRVAFNMLPWTIYSRSRPFLHNISCGFNFDYNQFKQDAIDEGSYYRNAQRFNFNPYLNLAWGYLGPVDIRSKVSLDAQSYKFNEHDNSHFSKYSFLFTTEADVLLEKIWGNAFVEKKPIQDADSLLRQRKNDLLIGHLPSIQAEEMQFQYIEHKAYKHEQHLKLKHYYLTDSKWSGDAKFYEQIQHEQGVFDYIDTLVEKNYLLSDELSKKNIPMTNTIEFNWSNSLLEKSSTNDNSNFTYKRLAYLNMSQGYIFDAPGSEFADHLSRLNVAFGGTYRKFNFFVDEYYFYQGKGHILDVGLSYSFPLVTLTTAYSYNSFSIPLSRRYKINLAVRPMDVITFDMQYDYDLEKEELIGSSYRALYSPHNNCWKLALGFERTMIKSSYSVNFLFNFGGEFSSLQ